MPESPAGLVRRHKTIRLLALAATAYLLFSAVAGIFLAESILRPPRRPVVAEAKWAQSIAQDHQAILEPVEIAAGDRTPLRGWLFRPAKRNGHAVLLHHGVADSRVGVLRYAPLLLRRGYTVLAPDARGHGESAGLATYGALEAADTRAWIAWLVDKEGAQCVFGLGQSMGAAILLQSLGAAPRFCGVVAESSFASFREVAYDRFGQPFSVGPWLGRTLARPVLEAGLLYTHLRYGISLDAASPESVVANSPAPVLLIHGTADRNIPPRHSERLRARNPERISLWRVPGATHTGALGAAPAEFEARVLTFFDLARSQHPGSHKAAP